MNRPFITLEEAQPDPRIAYYDIENPPPELPQWGEERVWLRFFHDMIQGEMHGAESLGRTLYDFPNEPWEFRMDTARQCYDEVRHAEMAIQRLRELGGEIGMFPVQRWGFGKQIEPRDVVERLATLNLAFEARAMGFLKKIRQHFYKIGDEASALLFDFVLADEIPHAMVGHKWVPELTKDDPERYQRALRRRDEIIRAWTEIQEKARQNGKPGATLHDVGRVDEGRFMGSV